MLTTLCFLAAVVALAPPPRQQSVAPMGPRPVVVVAGEPHGDLYIPPSIDRWFIQLPPLFDDHAILKQLDDIVSRVVSVLTTTRT